MLRRTEPVCGVCENKQATSHIEVPPVFVNGIGVDQSTL